MELQAAHDALLANMPSGVSHDAAACPFCSALEDGDGADTPTGGDIVSTFTQEQLDAAVAEALAPLQAELDNIKAGQEEEAVNARITELETAHAAQVADLQSQLDTATLKADTAEKQYNELVEALEAAANAEVEAAIFAAVREERIAQVKEVASFSEEHIEASADRWAAMDEEHFTASLSDWAAVAAASSSEGEGTPSFQSKMQASAEDREQDGKETLPNLRAELMSAKLVGIDLGTI